jgi:hypothetical protein
MHRGFRPQWVCMCWNFTCGSIQEHVYGEHSATFSADLCPRCVCICVFLLRLVMYARSYVLALVIVVFSVPSCVPWVRGWALPHKLVSFRTSVHGHTGSARRSDFACGFEVLLPTGYHTCFGEARAHPPFQDLLRQSFFAEVTVAGERPPHVVRFVCDSQGFLASQTQRLQSTIIGGKVLGPHKRIIA